MKADTNNTSISRFSSQTNPCKDAKNIYIIVDRKKRHRYKIRKKVDKSPQTFHVPSLSNAKQTYNNLDASQRSSMPELGEKKIEMKLTSRHSDNNVDVNNPFRSNYIVNIASGHRVPVCLNPFNNPLAQARFRIYRCQLNTTEESCCCSCNSDAMFEVMKSLYDCYKKKNCDHCNCILCGHLPKEERRLGEMRKSVGRVSTTAVGTGAAVKKKDGKMKKSEKSLAGKTPAEKENIIKNLIATGQPLPEGKTASEKALIKKVKTDVGVKKVPSEKVRKAKEEGLLTPLEGKTPEQKEKILRGLAKHGIPLPEGKTASDKALIKKVKTDVAVKGVPSEKVRKAKEEGLLTPLEGKTPEQKEKILRGLAKHGIPLPEGKTASEKSLIKKVKTDMAIKNVPSEKVRKAKEEGLLTPLEGKTPEQKEKILRGLATHGIPLPEGKTPSEKALIAKVKSSVKSPSEQKEQILRAQADLGVPLPEGRTPSEKALIQKIQSTTPRRKTKTRSVSVRKPTLPPEKVKKLDVKTAKVMKEGKGPSDECICHILTPESEKVSSKAKMSKGELPKITSEKLKAAKAAGLLTPLEGKTPQQKEKILRELAKQGLPLPEAKTASEKRLVEKVRADMSKKSITQKSKIKAISPVTSEKLRAAKAAGLMTPLTNKTPAEKERILRGLAKHGIPLPEGKTASEKQLIDKVRADMSKKSITQKSKTKAISPVTSEKLRAAKAAGLMTPLTNKTPAEKERILRGLAKHGIPLPEGKTASEKQLIDKVRADMSKKSIMQKSKTKATSPVPSEKLRAAKAAGLLTPLSNKTPAEKEKILRGLAKAGMPLPEGKTVSEKDLIKKVRKDMGLPPEPRSPSVSDKLQKAHAAGLVTPLEGKTPAQKEKILKTLAEAGVPLPDGRTSSEKALIKKVQAEVAVKPSKRLAPSDLGPPALPPEKRQKLDKKTAKVMKEGKGPSDECICGLLTPESERTMKTSIAPKISEKLRKSQAANLLASLDGKPSAQKEKILKDHAKTGKPLPEGRTPSEKALIKKIKAEVQPKPSEAASAGRIQSAKLSKSQTNALLASLDGKPLAQKEKILKDHAKMGKPLPEGRTPSEKALINKIKAEVQPKPSAAASAGRIQSAKLSKSQTNALLASLDGKPLAQKEKILKDHAKMGKPLPEGRTPSEKALINKVKAEVQPKPSAAASAGRIQSAKLSKSQTNALLASLDGKPLAQKEKILKDHAKMGKPLPEGRTPSEKALINKVKAEVQPKPSAAASAVRIKSAKLSKSQTAALLASLDGKPLAQKEKILKDHAKMGKPLPEGRTPSEKALINKIKAEVQPTPSVTASAARIQSEKLRKAKAAGLLTPLGSKTQAQKEKKLAPSTLPPEKRQKLDKKTAKVMKEGKGPSDECICSLLTPESDKVTKLSSVLSGKSQKAKGTGHRTPLTGKTPAQKEKILREQAKKGIPLTEPRTSSEKLLVEKIKKEVGLAPSSGAVVKKSRSKKTSFGAGKKSAKAISAGKQAGIAEEFQDVLKTTTCDRGCGCDKKKIRFKHSYVKIKVTSPDFSSLCPCPNECIPGVINGVLTDNEGIKVTVGAAVGLPSFSVDTSKNNTLNQIYFNNNINIPNSTESIAIKSFSSVQEDNNVSLNNSKQNVYHGSFFNHSEDSMGSECNRHQSVFIATNTCSYEDAPDLSSDKSNTDFNDCVKSLITSSNASSVISISVISKDCSQSGETSFESIYVIKTESSLSLSRSNDENMSRDRAGTISVISFVYNSSASHSSHYLYYSQTDTMYSEEIVEDEECFTNTLNYSTVCCETSSENIANENTFQSATQEGLIGNTDVLILRVSDTSMRNLDRKYNQESTLTEKPILIINDLNSKHDVRAMVNEIISRKLIEDVSSVFIVVPSSDAETECTGFSSTICIEMSENMQNWSNCFFKNEICDNEKNVSKKGFKIINRGRTPHSEDLKAENNDMISPRKVKKRKDLELSRCYNGGNKLESHGMDTSCDRPCSCCVPKMGEETKNLATEHCIASVGSELVAPMFVEQGAVQGIHIGKNIDNPIKQEPIPVRPCIVPPCTSHTSCHDTGLTKNNVNPPPSMAPGITCSGPHRRDKLKGPKPCAQEKSTAVGSLHPWFGGVDIIDAKNNPMKMLDKLPACTLIKTNSCSNCGPSNVIDGKISCFCSGNEKKVKIERKCPCQMHEQRSQDIGRKTKGCQCNIKEKVKDSAASNDTCTCKNRKKGKKKVCECPQVPEEPLDLDPIPCIDEKAMRKMQSDLTQTTSGFKIHTQKKVPEIEMSYEDIMEYCKTLPDAEDVDALEDNQSCPCKPRRKKAKDVDCLCPPEEPEELVDSPIEVADNCLKGLKLHVDGKGTNSKGLSGICCFDMVQENKRVVTFKSSNYLPGIT